MIKKLAIGFAGGFAICWGTMSIGLRTAYSSNLFWLIFGLDNNIYFLFHEHGSRLGPVRLISASMLLAESTISLLFALTFLLVVSLSRYKRAIGYILVVVLLLATFVWFRKPVWAPTPF